MKYNFPINQTFAKIFVEASCSAWVNLAAGRDRTE
jgi:hypothetical protein